MTRIAATTALCAYCVGLLLAEAARGADADDPLAFRRVFGSAKEMARLTQAGRRFLPIDSKEFENLLEQAHAALEGVPRATGAHLKEATFTARLEENKLTGTGLLTIDHEAGDAALLELSPCNFAITNPTWGETDVSAALGHDEQGKLQVLVTHDGDLRFNWALHSQRSAGGESSFELRIPPAPKSHLLLDLPPDITPLVDNALIESTGGDSDTLRRWRFEIGGRRHVSLRLVTNRSKSDSGLSALLRQSTTYDLSQRGLDVSVQLNLDIHNEPLRELAIELDPGVELVGARIDSHEIARTVEADEKTGIKIVRLEFAEPVSGLDKSIRLTAVAKLVTRQSWRLPQIRVRGVHWQEGAATLMVSSPVAVRSLTLRNCRQTKFSQLPLPLAGELLEFQSYSPSAEIEVNVDYPAERCRLQSAQQVAVGSLELNAQTIARFTAQESEHFNLRAKIEDGWTIDAIESSPADAILDWSALLDPAGQRTLEIRLAKAVSAKRPVQLAILGRRPVVSDQALKAPQLSMVTFEDVVSDRALVNLQSSDSTDFDLTGGERLHLLDPRQLAAGDLQLFAEAPQGRTFVLDAGAQEATIAITPRRPKFTADIQIDAVVSADSLTETCLVRCAPQTNPIHRVLVHFTQPHETAWQWSIAGSSGASPVARRVDEQDEAKNPSDPQGETWEVRLRTPRTSEFELRAVRKIPFRADMGVSLASLPEAAQQRGTVTVRAVGGDDVSIVHRRLLPAPSEILDAAQVQTVRGTFRYEPGQIGSSAKVLSLSTADKGQVNPGAWVWSCELDSRYAAAGESIHLASYRIQSVGRSFVTLTLPESTKLRSAWTAGERLSTQLIEDGQRERKLRVDLAPNRAFTTVAIQYASADALGSYLASIEPPLAQVDAPVLGSRWTAWLPPGYHALDTAANAPISGTLSPNGRQRLLGMLGRGDNEPVFNPALRTSWQRLLSHGPDKVDEEALVDDILDKIERAVSRVGTNNEAAVTWGELFTRISRESASRDWDVAIDAYNLERIGLTYTTKIENLPELDEPQFAAAVLRRVGIVLIVQDRLIVATSAAGAARNHEQLSPLKYGVSFRGPPAWLSDDAQAIHNNRDEVIGLAGWKARIDGQLPWVRSEMVAETREDSRGWNACSFAASGTELPRLQIVRMGAVRSVAWAIFLCVLGVGLWGRGRTTAWIGMAGALGSTALVVPASVAMLLAPAFLASLCCLLVALIQRMPLRKTPASRSVVERRLVSTLQATCLFLAVALLGRAAFGSEQPAASARDSRSEDQNGSTPRQPDGPTSTPAPLREETPVQEVFVPIDEHGQPTGTKYLIGEEFYKQLYRLAGSLGPTTANYLIRDAKYRGVLVQEATGRNSSVHDFKAEFNVLVLARDADVRLPLGAENQQANVRSVKVDGQPVSFVKDETGNTLLITRSEPGECRIEISLDVSTNDYGPSAGFDIAVPTTPTALLELTVPNETVRPELLGQIGVLKPAKATGVVIASLGPVDRISVRWDDDLDKAGANSSTESEELLWCSIQPGSVVLDARFKLHVVQGALRQIRLVVDPRLRLVSSTGGSSPVSSVRSLGGNPEVLQLEIAPSDTDRPTLDLKFLLTGTSGIGNIRIPRLETAAVRATRRLLAVSIDPSLQYEEPSVLGEEVKPVASADFLAAWGPSENRPQLTYAVPRGEPGWLLATRAREPVTEVEQVVTLNVGAQSTTAELSAQLTTTGGQNYQLRVRVPSKFEPRFVSCIAETAKRVLRWSRSADDVITVFLSAPSAGKQQLTLHGEFNAPLGQSLTVPTFEVLDCKLLKSQFLLLRQPDVILEANSLGMLKPVEAISYKPAGSNLGSVIGSYEDPRGNVELSWSRNLVSADATIVTTMQREGDAWFAEVELAAHVREGVLDMLRFNIPQQWVEPLQIDQPATYELVAIPGENRRQLIVRPRAPVTGDYRVKLRGRVSVGGEDQLRVPEIVPLGMSSLDRFVVLPSQFELQQILWDAVVGLRATELPKSIAAPTEPATTYAVLADGFQASLKSIDRSSGELEATLMDVHVMSDSPHQWQGVVDFDLKPSGKPSCLLQLPEHTKLLHVTVAGVPARMHSESEGRWRIELGPAHLPQRIEVLFERRGDRSSWSAPRHLESPYLVGVPVRRTLWTVFAPWQPSIAPSSQQPLSGSPSTLEFARLENIADLIGLAKDAAAGTSVEDMRRWQRPWEERLQASRALLAYRQAIEGVSYAAELKDIADRLGRGNNDLGRSGVESIAAATGQTVAAAAAEEPALTCLLPGAAPTLEVRNSASTQRGLFDRWRYALDIAGFALIGTLLSRKVRVQRWMVYAVLAGAALGAWWLMTPSFIGLLLAVLIMVYAIIDRRHLVDAE